jgi:DNA helicase-2/ATP-dependent DNA helicase PcrA
VSVREHLGADCAARISCVLGGPGTGKTERLVGRIASAARAEGGDAGHGDVRAVVALCATPVACDELKARLSRVTPTDGVLVTTARELELGILSGDRARAWSGRDPRLLTNFETNVLIEDMKTSGVHPHRLREMLKFLYRGWTELADDDPAWLFLQEELDVHGLLGECLSSTRSILEPELANLAVNYLRADASALSAARVPLLLIDDAQALSLASQALCEMIAGEELWVAGDPLSCAEVYESYPNPSWLEELSERDGVSVERLGTTHCPVAVAGAEARLSAAIAGTLDAMGRERLEENAAEEAREAGRPYQEVLAERLADAGEEAERPTGGVTDGAPIAPAPADGAPQGSVRLVVSPSPELEMEAVRDAVRSAIEEGVDPSDVYVASPNRVWARKVASSLSGIGIPSVSPFEASALNGDVRDLTRCVNARVYTLIELVADPRNPLAWRCWCGFGDWLANSPGFSALRRACLSSGIDLVRALDEGEALRREGMAADEDASVGRILAAYGQAKEHIAALSELRGEELVRRAVEIVAGPGDEKALASMLPLYLDGAPRDAPARELVASARRSVFAPRFGAESEGAVRVGTLELVRGTRPRKLVVCGFVNGFIPSHAYFDEVATTPDKRAGMHVDCMRRLYGALGACDGDVLFTAFSSIEASRAERLGLREDRIRMRDGVRVATVSTSVLAKDLGLQR